MISIVSVDVCVGMHTCSISYPEPAILLSRNERLWDNRSPEVNLICCLLEWNVVVKTKC